MLTIKTTDLIEISKCRANASFFAQREKWTNTNWLFFLTATGWAWWEWIWWHWWRAGKHCFKCAVLLKTPTSGLKGTDFVPWRALMLNRSSVVGCLELCMWLKLDSARKNLRAWFSRNNYFFLLSLPFLTLGRTWISWTFWRKRQQRKMGEVPLTVTFRFYGNIFPKCNAVCNACELFLLTLFFLICCHS